MFLLKFYERIGRLPSTIITFVIVMIGWVFFRAHSVSEAMRMFKAMLGLQGLGSADSMFSDPVAWQVTPDRLAVLLVGVLLVYLLPTLRRFAHTPLRFLTIPLFVWAVATLSAQSFTPFLYFQF